MAEHTFPDVKHTHPEGEVWPTCRRCSYDHIDADNAAMREWWNNGSTDPSSGRAIGRGVMP